MTGITLEQARSLIAAAMEHGRKEAMKPLTVAVLDPGGYIVALEREDGASTMRPQIAIGKANGALALGVSSRKIAEMAEERPTFISALASMPTSGIIPAAGGIILKDAAGSILGAVGVTGDTSDNDETCAIAGAKAIAVKAS